VLTFAQDNKTLLRQWRAQKVFLYSKKQQRFIEDVSRRRGFMKMDSDL
jgi:hypothetical protein